MSVPLKPLDIFDIHDKHEYFTKNGDFSIGQIVQQIIDSKPFGDNAFYLFAHSRTADDGYQKKILWQPRLSKPSCEPNSMLFKVRPGSDEVRIIWMIPEEHLWKEYEKGKVCESSVIEKSIHDFKKNRKALEASEPDDPNELQMKAIYKEIMESQTQQSSTSLE